MKEPKTITEEYDASMWGKIFHNALARLYGERYREGYAENIKRQVIKDLLELGEEELRKAYPDPKDSLYWDWEANKQRMLKFIDLEIAHFKEGFTPLKLEKELAPYVIEINDKQKIKIGGRPDRIDVRLATPATAGGPSTPAKAGEGEKYYIIDYKLSKKPSAKTYRIPATPATEASAEREDLAGRGENFTEFQLPLYGLSFAKGNTEKIGGLIYYHLDENLKDFVALDILKEEGSDYIKMFKETILLPVLREIFDKNLPFGQTEDFDVCQRCLFVDHCGRRV
jgi:hypothetical protein